jgi:o-succinylbenzoate synthase
VPAPDLDDGPARAPIRQAEVLIVELPLLRPFVTGFGVTAVRHTVLVHLVDEDGVEGWGEGPALDDPYYLPETTRTTFVVAVNHALPLALRAERVDPVSACEAMRRIRGNTFAKAAVEAALWAMEADRRGVSMRELFGGKSTAAAVGESLSITETIDATLAEVSARLDEGYRRIKLKIEPGWDVEVVRAARELVGPDVMLQADANASYTLDDVDALAQLDDFGLACIEQPLGWDQLLGHAELQKRLATPVCLDESLRSLDDVRLALDIEACRNVNLKPARVGGVSESLRIAALCEQRGVPLWCGGMMESGIGRASNLALCSLPAFTEPADMSPASVLFDNDLVDPTYEIGSDGTIAIPSKPGLGFDVCRDRIAARTVDHATVAVPRGAAR